VAFCPGGGILSRGILSGHLSGDTLVLYIIVKTKCLLVRLCEVEVCPLIKKSQALDFVVNRFLMKLLNTSNLVEINGC